MLHDLQSLSKEMSRRVHMHLLCTPEPGPAVRPTRSVAILKGTVTKREN